MRRIVRAHLTPRLAPYPLYLLRSNDLSESGRSRSPLPEGFRTVESDWVAMPEPKREGPNNRQGAEAGIVQGWAAV